MITEVERGLSVTTNATVGELLEAWLEMASRDFSPKTVKETRGVIGRNLLPHIGSRPLKKLRPSDLDRLYQRLQASGGVGGKTRGRHTNHAWLPTTTESTPVDVFERSITSDWIDQPAIVRHAELNPTPEPPPDSTVGDTPASRRHARARSIVNAWTNPANRTTPPPRPSPPDLSVG